MAARKTKASPARRPPLDAAGIESALEAAAESPQRDRRWYHLGLLPVSDQERPLQSIMRGTGAQSEVVQDWPAWSVHLGPAVAHVSTTIPGPGSRPVDRPGGVVQLTDDEAERVRNAARRGLVRRAGGGNRVLFPIRADGTVRERPRETDLRLRDFVYLVRVDEPQTAPMSVQHYRSIGTEDQAPTAAAVEDASAS